MEVYLTTEVSTRNTHYSLAYMNWDKAERRKNHQALSFQVKTYVKIMLHGIPDSHGRKNSVQA